MELQQIRYFLALSEDLNFSRAAERCGVSQPSLTRAIKRLEDELGAQLIRRERSRTHLTELGRRIKPRLEQALSLTEIARSDADDFSRMSNVSLAIGVMCTVGPSRMISLVDHLGSEFPDLNVTLRTASGKEVVESLLEGKTDVAIVGMAEYPDEIAVHDLYHERYMIAFPPNHRFAKMNAIPHKEMAGEKYVLRLNCEYLDLFHATIDGCESSEFIKLQNSLRSMNISHKSEHEEWIQAMVIAGMGCAIVPEYMSLYTELQMRPLIEPQVIRTIGVATVRGRSHTPVVSYFTRLCQKINWGSESIDPDFAKSAQSMN
ncbi:MAG: LysR family transcriptional regulator [Granulosicoccus sp.]